MWLKERDNVKKDIKLYNVLFPLWMLLMFPVTWLFVLPGNFLIDSLVLCLGMYVLKICDKKDFYKKSIVKIFAIGIFSDIIGSAYMLAMVLLELCTMADEWYVTVPGVIISAVFIFVLNYFITFKNLDKKKKLILSLAFAIITAPYTFLVPSRWLYNY